MPGKKGNEKFEIIMNYQLNRINELEKYLEYMALRGWILYEVMDKEFTFVRGNEAEIRFHIDIKEKNSYNKKWNNDQVFMHEVEHRHVSLGWNYICSDTNIHIYASMYPERKPIQENSMRIIKTIHENIFKYRLLVALILPTTLLLLLIQNMKFGLFYFLDNYYNFVYLTILLASTILLGVRAIKDLVDYLKWYWKSKRSIQFGMRYQYFANRNFFGMDHLFIPAHLLCLNLVLNQILYYTNNLKSWSIIFGVNGLYLFMELRKRLKEKKLPFDIKTDVNIYKKILVYIGVVVLLDSYKCGLESEWNTDDQKANKMACAWFHDTEFLNSQDSDNLLVQEDTARLMSADNKHSKLSTEKRFVNKGNFMIRDFTYCEKMKTSEEETRTLSINYYETKSKQLYDRLIRENMEKFHDKKELDTSSFMSKKVYKNTSENISDVEAVTLTSTQENKKKYEYLVLYDEVILTVDSDFELSGQQMKRVYEKVVQKK